MGLMKLPVNSTISTTVENVVRIDHRQMLLGDGTKTYVSDEYIDFWNTILEQRVNKSALFRVASGRYVSIANIDHLYTKDKHLFIVTIDGGEYMLQHSIKKFAEDWGFTQIHRQYAVHPTRIQYVRRCGGKYIEVITRAGAVLRMSAARARKFKLSGAKYKWLTL